MSKLQEFVENTLNIPMIKEGGAVMDGTFALTPYYIDSLHGDGKAQDVSLWSSIDLFYRSKKDAIKNSILLYKALQEESCYACDNPDVSYEKESEYWRTTLRVQEVIRDE